MAGEGSSDTSMEIWIDWSDENDSSEDGGTAIHHGVDEASVSSIGTRKREAESEDINPRPKKRAAPGAQATNSTRLLRLRTLVKLLHEELKQEGSAQNAYTEELKKRIFGLIDELTLDADETDAVSRKRFDAYVRATNRGFGRVGDDMGEVEENIGDILKDMVALRNQVREMHYRIKELEAMHRDSPIPGHSAPGTRAQSGDATEMAEDVAEMAEDAAEMTEDADTESLPDYVSEPGEGI